MSNVLDPKFDFSREEVAHTPCFFSPGTIHLESLETLNVLSHEDVDNLPEAKRRRLQESRTKIELFNLLREFELLTEYQFRRLCAGSYHGLVLGNYRLLDRLSQGGMGVVYRGEHVFLRRPAAIKVLHSDVEADGIPIRRFFQEMRAIASLNHPNIVSASDAGIWTDAQLDSSSHYYIVMELLTGVSLDLAARKRRLGVEEACEIAFQICSALAEAHSHQLVHRDVKPSNVFLTADGAAKLLDFGLARPLSSRPLTAPGTILGTIDYMAPEQAIDASQVDHRADLFGLGATLYFALAGLPPFPMTGSLAQQVISRQTLEALEIRKARPDVPEALAAIVKKLMERSPADRFQCAQLVMQKMLPFLPRTAHTIIADRSEIESGNSPRKDHSTVQDSRPRVLIVDDDPRIRVLLYETLKGEGYHITEAEDGLSAVEKTRLESPDLVLLDVDLPQLSGKGVLTNVREDPRLRHTYVVMMSGGISADEMAGFVSLGANDFVTKPLSLVGLKARVRSGLEQQGSMKRLSHLNLRLNDTNRELESDISRRSADLVDARNALVMSLAKLVEARCMRASGHLRRMQRFCTAISTCVTKSDAYKSSATGDFSGMLDSCCLLYDIGYLWLPDRLVSPDATIDFQERLLLQSHTTLGAEALNSIARKHGAAIPFLHFAAEIARHHHERHDGNGYPDKLSGDDIPLAAKIVGLADTYETLRSRTIGRPAFSHGAAMEIIKCGSPGQFDPRLLELVSGIHRDLDEIFQDSGG